MRFSPKCGQFNPMSIFKRNKENSKYFGVGARRRRRNWRKNGQKWPKIVIFEHILQI
jgi:hypothetical protein